MQNQVTQTEQIQPTGAVRFSAVQIIRASKELSQTIRAEGARTAAEAALPYLIRSMEGAINDPFLKHLRFDQVGVNKLLFRVAMNGTPVERSAMARHLTEETGYAFPALFEMTKTGKSAEAIMLIKNCLVGLSDHYGFPLVGDVGSIAFTILNDYGGLSAADFLIFFDRAKSGRYKQDFQHLAVRGINYDFVKTWLEAYLDEREAAFEAMHLQGKPDNRSVTEAGGFDPAETLAEWERYKARCKVLEYDVQQYRNEWKKSLYERVILKTWYKEIRAEVPVIDQDTGRPAFDEKGAVTRTEVQQVICDESDSQRKFSRDNPVERMLPGTAERLIKRILYEYVVFHDAAETASLYLQLLETVVPKFAKEQHPEEMLTAEFKTLINQVNAFKNRVFTLDLLRPAIIKTQPETDPAKAVSLAVQEIKSQYYGDYIPKCLEIKYPALEIEDYIFASTLFVYTQAGFENPVKKILFE